MMESKAVEIEAVMKDVRGVKDLGVFRLVGQPNLLIQVDREASARYGLRVSDVNAVVQAAVGGQGVTQVYEGERLFDLVVRFLPEFRRDAEAIGNILVSTPNGARIPLKQVATIKTHTGAFIIYRENNERYIPIKFSVRDRDLESTVKEAQGKMAKAVSLPERYRIEWAGQYDQLTAEQKRLTMIVPVSLVLILFLLYTTFNSLKNALLSAGHRAVCAHRRHLLPGADRHQFQYLRGGGGHLDTGSGDSRRSPVNLTYRGFSAKRCRHCERRS